MQLLFLGMLLLLSCAVLLLQFYTASKKGFKTIADVVATGGRLAILNQRHGISLMAMAATTLYVGFTQTDWLLLRPAMRTGPLLVTILAGAAAVFVSMRAARQALHHTTSPSFEGAPEPYLLLRGLFLIFYELLFRAILLQYCLVWMPVPLALSVNVVLYVGVHAFSTRQELWGSLPFGLLLCGLTLYAGSVLPAVLLHLLLGLPYDILILSAPKFTTKATLS